MPCMNSHVGRGVLDLRQVDRLLGGDDAARLAGRARLDDLRTRPRPALRHAAPVRTVRRRAPIRCENGLNVMQRIHARRRGLQRHPRAMSKGDHESHENHERHEKELRFACFSWSAPEGLPPQNTKLRAATRTITSVSTAIANSPTTPTTSGRQPCFTARERSSADPTPANVKRNAHRDRFARSVDLRRGEGAQRGQRRDHEKPEHELRKLLPEKRALVGDLAAPDSCATQ